MAFIQARYLDGSSIQLTKCESVGHIMIQVADLHKRFAPEVAVTCPDTGRDLTDPHSQIPPPVVQIIIKPEEKITDANLLSALRLHGQYKDVATCARAYEMLQKRHSKNEIYKVLRDLLDKPDNGGMDIKIQKNIMETLLRVGVNLNYFLYKASKKGNASRVKMLLSAGTPVDCDEDETLLKYDAPALSVAARHGRVDVVKILLAQKADVNLVSVLNGHELGTPLWYCCRYEHADVARELITHGAVDDASLGPNRPLRIACFLGNAPLVELLLTHRVDPNYEHNPLHEDSPLMKACDSGSAAVVKLMLDHGARVDTKTIDEMVDRACSSADVMEMLLDCHMSMLLAVPLHTASKAGSLKMVNVLLGFKANANGITGSRQAPLHAATRSGRLDVVSTLLTHKANVNNQTSDGKTALDYAFDTNDKALGDMLKQYGAIFSANLTEKTFADQSEGESRNCSSASANKRRITDKNEEGSGYCSATSANKRYKKNEDETSGKKHFVCGNDLVQEKMERHKEHPSCKEDEKIEENKSGVSGSGTSAENPSSPFRTTDMCELVDAIAFANGQQALALAKLEENPQDEDAMGQLEFSRAELSVLAQLMVAWSNGLSLSLLKSHKRPL